MVGLPEELYLEAERIVRTSKQGYSSTSEFVKDAVRRRLEELAKLSEDQRWQKRYARHKPQIILNFYKILSARRQRDEILSRQSFPELPSFKAYANKEYNKCNINVVR